GSERQRSSARSKLRVQIDRRDLDRFAAGCRHGVKICSRQFVIRFVDPARRKINLRAVLRPNRVVFIEAAGGELARFHFLFGASRRGHYPDMTPMLLIDVTFIVLSIHRAGYHAHVTLVVGFRFARWSWRCLVCRLPRRSLGGGGSLRGGGWPGLFLVLFPFLFRKVLRVRVACERDVFSVWRPDRIASASWEFGKNEGIAAGHRQHCQLWRLRLAIFFRRAQEQQKFSVGRPARRCVVIALCELTWRFAARHRQRPNGSVIAFFLLVNGDAHKCNARAIRRHLRITDPDEIPKIFLSDGPLFRERGANAQSQKNDEARMTNNEGMTKHEVREQTSRVFRHLIILRCFDIRHSDFVISPPQSGRDHMCSITLSPNCEHLISVAPSIKRAKSYVTRLLAIAPLNPLRIRSAASVQPM